MKIMENADVKMDYECTFNTAEHTMTCIWKGGLLKLVACINSDTVHFLVDEKIKCSYSNVTVRMFENLLVDVQRIADTI